MTFNQMVRNLARNSVHFMMEGEVAKAQACLELIAFIRERGYENLRGKVELSVDNS
jgi:Fe-S cluster assembly ATPase SufC